jgi:hypothetical protein
MLSDLIRDQFCDPLRGLIRDLIRDTMSILNCKGSNHTQLKLTLRSSQDHGKIIARFK